MGKLPSPINGCGTSIQVIFSVIFPIIFEAQCIDLELGELLIGFNHPIDFLMQALH